MAAHVLPHAGFHLWNFGTGAIFRARDIFFCLSSFSW
jgi:hypothetical protein